MRLNICTIFRCNVYTTTSKSASTRKQVWTNCCRVSMLCETEVYWAVEELCTPGLENTELALSPKICCRIIWKLT